MKNTQIMEKSLKNTRTEQNLAIAYVAESTAVTRYTFYAAAAEKENYYEISNIFKETADNELHHAKIFLKYLSQSAVTTPVGVDPGDMSKTVENLRIAANEELHEGVELYLESAKVAEEEGFPQIASQFRAIAEVEDFHRNRFLALIDQIEKDTVWKRDKPIKWQCLVCGYVFEGTEPPKVCPACLHPYTHYKPLDSEY